MPTSPAGEEQLDCGKRGRKCRVAAEIVGAEHEERKSRERALRTKNPLSKCPRSGLQVAKTPLNLKLHGFGRAPSKL